MTWSLLLALWACGDTEDKNNSSDTAAADEEEAFGIDTFVYGLCREGELDFGPARLERSDFP